VELGAHDVVVMSSKDADACARLPVPDPHCLIIRGGNNPGICGVEEHSADIVKVPGECEQTLSLLVVPHLDLVVITTGNKQRLGVVESHTTDRTCKDVARQGIQKKKKKKES